MIFFAESVARRKTASSNVRTKSGRGPDKAFDGKIINFCLTNSDEREKRIWVDLEADYEITMIYIVNVNNYLDRLIDFDIRVGKYSSPSF